MVQVLVDGEWVDEKPVFAVLGDEVITGFSLSVKADNLSYCLIITQKDKIFDLTFYVDGILTYTTTLPISWDIDEELSTHLANIRDLMVGILIKLISGNIRSKL